MKQRLGPLLLLIVAVTHFTEVRAEIWRNDYLSGPETCRKYANRTSDELGKFVQVPIDYSHPELGTTPIYYWLKKPFDPNQQTLVFLAGGPGASSHDGEFAGEFDFNIVYLDQRGVSCSKPLSHELSHDPKFYSSENTAHDLELVRKDLGVDRISVYGHSYGTVPATIYASRFPSQTQALILEGTIYAANESLYQSERTRGLMQRHYDSLPKPVREKILELSRRPDVAPEWYSRVNRFMMYRQDSFRLLDYWLNNSFGGLNIDAGNASNSLLDRRQTKDFGLGLFLEAMINCKEFKKGSASAFFCKFLNQRTTPNSEPKPAPKPADDSSDADPARSVAIFSDYQQSEEEFGFGLVMLAMLGCKELELGSPGATYYSVFNERGQLVSDRNPEPQNRLCRELGISPSLAYSAERYPVTVPVTYFQGEYDPATDLPGARLHFQNVPHGFAQFLVLERGGHLPNLSSLQGYLDGTQAEALQRKIFSMAVKGKPIPVDVLREFNDASPLRWNFETR